MGGALLNDTKLPQKSRSEVRPEECRNRGRTRKSDSKSGEAPSCWLGEVFFHEGHAWGVDEQLSTIWLGREGDILPVVKGEKEIFCPWSRERRRYLITYRRGREPH
jgi:hypothetical protein